ALQHGVEALLDFQLARGARSAKLDVALTGECRDRVGALLRDALLLGGSLPGSGGSALGGSDLRGSAAAHGCLDLLLPRDLLFLGGLDLAEGLLAARSEEHTSELQSRENLVCRL